MFGVTTDSGRAVYKRLTRPTVTDPHDVILKVLMAGICRTDILAAEGSIAVNHSGALGHEFAGLITEKGSAVDSLEVGQRVAVNPLLSCEACDCHGGQQYLCADSRLLGICQPGAFADYVKVSQSNCFAAPDILSDQLVAYAEPVAAMLSIFDCGINKQQIIGVAGSDRIASLCRFMLASKGFKLQRDPDHLVDVLIITSFDEVDVWLNSIRPGGKLIIKDRRPFKKNISPLEIVTKRLTLIGANYAAFDTSVAYLIEHRQGLAEFMGDIYPMSDFKQAFEADQSHKVFLTSCADLL